MILAAWRLRWRVLRRGWLGALTGVVLLGLGGVFALAARALAGQGVADPPLAVGLSLGLAALVLGLAARADALLHRAPELALLLPAGLSPRELVRLRLCELWLSALAALLPPLIGLAALRAAQGRSPSLLLVPAALVLAAGLAAPALVLARAARAAPPLLLLALAAAGALLAAAPAAPGAALLSAAAGELAGALPLVLGAGGGLLLLEASGPLGHARALDRAGRRAARARGGAVRALLAALRRPLGAAPAALLLRDLSLLLRGAFPRGALALLLLPLGLLPARAAAADPSLEGWQLLLAGLLVSGGLASAAAYVFGVDFPRARAPSRELERVQPLRGAAVFRSRAAPALLVSWLLLLGAAALIAGATRAPAPGELLLRGALLCAAVVHDGVGQGLAGEAAGDPAAGAAAYPLRSGALVILLAGGLLVSPLAILAWPLLGWPQEARRAARAWERAEVPRLREAAG